MKQKKWALLSVFNKDGIVEFARRLEALGWNIISSGGTARTLKCSSVKVLDTAELVGGGAILGHRVVTLSREIHAGLLADPNDSGHVAEMKKLDIPFINLVCCDFYPLSDAIGKEDASIESVVEFTDIGGPTMVRSAAKGGRIVICRHKDRQLVIKQLEDAGDVSAETRQMLRARAEYEVAQYCLDSARFHSKGDLTGFTGELVLRAKYGENAPQIPAGFYSTDSDDPLALDKFKVVSGTEPSYNNLCDIDRLLQTLTHAELVFWKNWEFKPDIMVGVKHGNPCGAAVNIGGPDKRIELARKVALGDKLAIFGGWIMANFGISTRVATALVRAGMRGKGIQRFDGVVAPIFGPDVASSLERVGGKCRLMINLVLGQHLQLDTSPRFRYARGGFLMQPNYTFVPEFSKMQIHGKRNKNLEMSLALAWAVGCTSNSNTISIVKKKMLIGNGVGQQARVWASKLAISRAVNAGHEKKLDGAVAYSDSFFPYPDAVDILIKNGIRAIFTTSGSKAKGGGDPATIKACEEAGVILYMLPDREARGFFGH